MFTSPVSGRMEMSNFYLVPSSQREPTVPKINENIEKTNKESKSSNKRLSPVVVATALAAAVLSGGIAYRHYNSVVKGMKHEIKELASDNDVLKGINKTLEEQIENSKNKLEIILKQDSSDVPLSEDKKRILEDLENKINNPVLDYDLLNPPEFDKIANYSTDSIPLPSSVGTNNRAGIVKLNIPEIASDGRFEFEVPMTDSVKITHERKDFNPVKNKESIISLNYGKSVQWDNDKVARDILQNFYDGHGQTLDGVKLSFIPLENFRYRVRIEGKSTFSPEKAIYLGLSSKQFNDRAAGNYGEGVKMAALKLLTEGGAENVKIASDNWICTWNIGQNELFNGENSKVMCFSVDKAPQIFDGNYLEFETNNFYLLDSLRNSINRFYHSGNVHFKCPDFENDVILIKNLPAGEKGGIYIAGQRFQYDGDYNGLDGIVIALKEKTLKDIFDTSRDRTSIDKGDLEKIGKWVAEEQRMSNQDKANLLKALESYWDDKPFKYEHPMDSFLRGFLQSDKFCYYNSSLYIDFPEDKYVAYSYASDQLILDLMSRGYRICKDEFKNIGMQDISQLMIKLRQHQALVPTDIQKKKIILIKDALLNLSAPLRDKHFSEDELNAKIYIFDNKAANECKMYSDTCAEAITKIDKSYGFWIDRNYLNRASFTDVLETALHELSHKEGGDGSADFSYKLTDVNRCVIDHILINKETRSILQMLANIWEKLS